MAELRRDRLSGLWVVLAPGRASRPESLGAEAVSGADTSAAECPFCEGHESRTPPEVDAVREGDPDGPGWRVRVVPNLYPAFTSAEEPTDLSNPLREIGPAFGVCEVIVHSPDHFRWLPYLSAPQAEVVMAMTLRRYLHHSSPGVGNILPLYNHKRAAGASLAHPHGQLYATRLTSPTIEAERIATEAFFRAETACVLCRTVDEELALDERVVAESESFVAIAPYASRSPFEVMIVPRRHGPDFGEIDEAVAAELGVFMRDVLRRIVDELGDVPLNWWIHSLVNAAGESLHSYHWHLEIRPKLTELAGFELGTGTYINTTAPEVAAAALKGRSAPGPEASAPLG